MRVPVGRLRRKLAAMLRALGLDIEADGLWIQVPAYRTVQADAAMWGGHGRWRELHDGISCNVSSFNTMGDCVRYGIDLSSDFRNETNLAWSEVEVDARMPFRVRGKLGTQSTAVYLVQAGAVTMSVGDVVKVKSALDTRVRKWHEVTIDKIDGLDGPVKERFYFLSFR